MTDDDRIRPFDFMMLFWGERYRTYFTDLCLPSLLAPQNLPLLKAEDGHRFLIATTKSAWRSIQDLPIMHRMRRHTTPVWVEIGESEKTSGGSFSQYAANLRHMGQCLKQLVETAYAASNYGCMLLPDILVADGLVFSMQKFARAGHKLVLCSSLRQSEEAILEELKARGFIAPGPPMSQTVVALSVPPRVAAELAVRHLHPEMAVFEEGANGQPFISPFRYWRLSSAAGMILHSFYAVPILVDFGYLRPNHTDCLQHGHFENVYISDNFKECSNIHVVQDSDELFILSLTPKRVNNSSGPVGRRQARMLWHTYRQLCSIRSSAQFYVGRNRDLVKLALFRCPIRWHTRDLDDPWMTEERKIEGTIERAMGDYWLKPIKALPRISFDLHYFWLDLYLSLTAAGRQFRVMVRKIIRTATEKPN